MQMMFKSVAAVAAFAAIGSVSACGWMDESCCDINPNNPNEGDCIADRSVCWETKCGMCGVNGKPACTSTDLLFLRFHIFLALSWPGDCTHLLLYIFIAAGSYMRIACLDFVAMFLCSTWLCSYVISEVLV